MGTSVGMLHEAKDAWTEEQWAAYDRVLGIDHEATFRELMMSNQEQDGLVMQSLVGQILTPEQVSELECWANYPVPEHEKAVIKGQLRAILEDYFGMQDTQRTDRGLDDDGGMAYSDLKSTLAGCLLELILEGGK